MLAKSIAPPLQIRLDGTTLKLAPNPHQKSIFPTYRSLQRLGRPKHARGHLSQKIGDRWHLSWVDSHSHWKPLTLPPRAGPTHISCANLPPERGGGGLELIDKSPVNQPKSAGSPFDNSYKVNWTSKPSSLYTFSVKFGWILRLKLTLKLLLCKI